VSTQGNYIKDTLSRTLNEKPLFGALIVALSNPVSYLTYDEIVARKF
jgi:hypothetical protein